MRGIRVRAGIVIATWAVCNGVRADPSEVRPSAEACAAAEAVVRAHVVKQQTGERWVVASSPASIPDIKASLFWKTGWRGNTAPPALIHSYLRTKSRSAVDLCGNVRNILTSAAIPYGDREVARANAKRRSSSGAPPVLWGYNLFTLSLPVMSQDRRSALIATSVACGPLCGNGRTQYWTLNSGGWVLAGEHGDYIS